jgi:hypothetical protein
MITETRESISWGRRILSIASRMFCRFHQAPVTVRPILWSAVSVAASTVGGWVWEHLCKFWLPPFNLGGNHEPYAQFAFIWGAIVFLPVIFLVRFFSSEIDPSTPWKAFCWIFSKEAGLILAYSLFAGAVAMAFYGWRPAYSVRTAITSLGLSLESQELAIIAIWAFAAGSIPPVVIRLAGGKYSVKNIYYVCGIPALLAVVVCLLALLVYFSAINPPVDDPDGHLRGVVAGMALRFSVFWGLWLVIDNRRLQPVLDYFLTYLRKNFEDPPEA